MISNIQRLRISRGDEKIINGEWKKHRKSPKCTKKNDRKGQVKHPILEAWEDGKHERRRDTTYLAGTLHTSPRNARTPSQQEARMPLRNDWTAESTALTWYATHCLTYCRKDSDASSGISTSRMTNRLISTNNISKKTLNGYSMNDSIDFKMPTMKWTTWSEKE